MEKIKKIVFIQVELIEKYGYHAESYPVATYDKYILEMHRITGPKNNPDPKGKPAILLMHGIVMSSSDWIILGPEKALGKINQLYYQTIKYYYIIFQ